MASNGVDVSEARSLELYQVLTLSQMNKRRSDYEGWNKRSVQDIVGVILMHFLLRYQA